MIIFLFAIWIFNARFRIIYVEWTQIWDSNKILIFAVRKEENNE